MCFPTVNCSGLGLVRKGCYVVCSDTIMFIKVQYIHLGLVHQKKPSYFQKRLQINPIISLKGLGWSPRQEKFIVSYMRKTELKYAWDLFTFCYICICTLLISLNIRVSVLFPIRVKEKFEKKKDQFSRNTGDAPSP